MLELLCKQSRSFQHPLLTRLMILELDIVPRVSDSQLNF